MQSLQITEDTNMKQLTEWLLITVAFVIGAAIQSAIFGAPFSYPFVIGLSLGWALSSMYQYEKTKGKK